MLLSKIPQLSINPFYVILMKWYSVFKLFHWTTQAPRTKASTLFIIQNQTLLRMKENVLNNYPSIASLIAAMPSKGISGYFIALPTCWCWVSWHPHIQPSAIFLLVTSLDSTREEPQHPLFNTLFLWPHSSLLLWKEPIFFFLNFSIQTGKLKSFFWISSSPSTSPKSLK